MLVDYRYEPKNSKIHTFSMHITDRIMKLLMSYFEAYAHSKGLKNNVIP